MCMQVSECKKLCLRELRKTAFQTFTWRDVLTELFYLPNMSEMQDMLTVCAFTVYSMSLEDTHFGKRTGGAGDRRQLRI